MKHIPLEAKVAAYNEAIDYLSSEECSYDTEDDRRARKWLSDKLSRECDQLVRRRKTDR